MAELTPLQVGDYAKDGLGHTWKVLRVITPYYYVMECQTLHHGTAKMSRSELRTDGEQLARVWP